MKRLLRRLAAVEVAVPDPEATVRFLSEGLGFAAHEEAGGVVLVLPARYGESGAEEVLRITEGDRTEIRSVIFEALDEAALEKVEANLGEAGIDGHRADGEIRFNDPEGVPVSCRLPREPRDELPPGPLRPRRIGHVNLKVPDANRAGRFYQEVLGLRLSEVVGELLVFLRIGNDHHNLGFRSGAEQADLHHVAFEIPGWESYRTVCDHLASSGYLVEYGPGRHGPGHNLFVYVVDPSSGLRLELFADMAHVDDDHEPVRWESVDRVRTVNVWGPQPPQSFLD